MRFGNRESLFLDKKYTGGASPIALNLSDVNNVRATSEYTSIWPTDNYIGVGTRGLQMDI